MSDDEDALGTEAEQRGDALAPEARDLEAELRDRVDDGTAAPAAVDGDTAAAFWAAVFYVNVGVLLVVVGPVLYVSQGEALLAAVLVAAGVVVFARAYSVYRAFDADDGDGNAGDVDGVDTAEGDD